MLQKIESLVSKDQTVQASFIEQAKSSQQNETLTSRTSEYEISEFMKNFARALWFGNRQEIVTYFADEAHVPEFPELLPLIDQNEDSSANVNPLFLNPKISAEKEFGVYSALICLRGINVHDYSDNGGWHLLTCVLDKTEGYWQIVTLKHSGLV